MQPKIVSVETLSARQVGAVEIDADHEPADLLTVFSSAIDELILGTMLQSVSCRRTWARSVLEAISVLQQVPVSVVVCEQQLPDGDWRVLLQATQAMDDPPLLVVASRSADEGLWAEVLNCCGFDVLAKPFRRDEVLYCINCACRARGRRNAACARRACASI